MPSFKSKTLSGTGDVTFYAAGNAVNLDTESGGDVAMSTQLKIEEEDPDRVESRLHLLNLTIFPNPVDEVLNFKIGSRYSGNFEMYITDAQGKIVKAESIELIEGQNDKNINVNNLPNGLYLIHLYNENEFTTQTMLKM